MPAFDKSRSPTRRARSSPAWIAATSRCSASYYSETQSDSRWKSFITFALGKSTEITPHYVRHNYCCLLFEQGVPLLEVQRVMGHDDLNTTMKHYAHYTETMQQNARPQLKLVGKTA